MDKDKFIFYNGSRVKDLRGKTFGNLQPLEIVGIKNRYAIWNCKCTLCGNTREVSAKYLTQKEITMCKECAKKVAAEQRKKNKKESFYNDMDISDMEFGFWKVLEKADFINGTQMWKCRCKCGKEKDVSVYNLVHARSLSCGCYKYVDISGKEFGFLKAIEPVFTKEGLKWKCKCRCGNIINITASNLHCYHSCGCIEEVRKSEHTHITWAMNGGQKLRSNNTSGIRGVGRANGKWGARITFKGKFYWLGTYDTKEEAAQARQTAEKHLYTDFLEWYFTDFKRNNGKRDKGDEDVD